MYDGHLGSGEKWRQPSVHLEGRGKQMAAIHRMSVIQRFLKAKWVDIERHLGCIFKRNNFFAS